MQHPTSLYNAPSVAARFRQLPRGKQWILAALATLSVTLLVAATLYAIQPDSGTPLGTGAAAGRATDTVLPFPTPTLLGQFVSGSGAQTLVVLTLRQYGDAVTGTYTTQTCVTGGMQATQRIVTGQLLPNDGLRLTFTAADSAHSTTNLYVLAATDTGFTLQWNNHLGQPQSQAWQRVSAASTPKLAC